MLHLSRKAKDLAISVAVALPIGWGINVAVEGLLGYDSESLALVRLEYNRGFVTQEHVVLGAQSLHASWAAKLIRGGTVLCYGSGEALYKSGNPRTYTLDDWVGGDCPDARPGDELEGSWAWWHDVTTRKVVGGNLTLRAHHFNAEN